MKGFHFIVPMLCLLAFSEQAVANCNDPELRKKVAEISKEEGVKEWELLSIIAHESGCKYFAIAWNLPKKPETAQSKFFDNLADAKSFAQSLIATGRYRVDVGIGQINNEANIRPKGWSLDEVLNPETALLRVAHILKERGWKNYHSSNPVFAQKWRVAALEALNRIDTQKFKVQNRPTFSRTRKPLGPLVVFCNLPISSTRIPVQYF